MSETNPVIIEPDYFSNMVMLRAQETRESLLETLAVVSQELDIEELKVKRLITPPLLSRLEAECLDKNLLKNKIRSKKLFPQGDVS